MACNAAVILMHKKPCGDSDPSDAARHIRRRPKGTLSLKEVLAFDHIMGRLEVFRSIAVRGNL